jgi:hypothetical protein
MNNEEEKIIEKLILDGGLETVGVDQETGELLYSFTPKIKNLMPDLYNEHMTDVNSCVMKLWEKGFLEIDFFASEPIITLSEKAFNRDMEEDEVMVGRVEYVMTNPGLLGLPGSEYSMEYAEDDKPVIVRNYKQEDGAWEEEPYVSYHRMSTVTKIESLSVSVDMVVEMGSNGTGIPTMPSQSDMENMYAVQVSKSYNSDNEDEDKWDNMTKACWVGYEQRGMKEKGGRMVPNCVPVNKLKEMENEMAKAKPNYGDFIKPRRGGSTPSDPKLYARVVQAAKDKFDVYPSAVANSWVVQEYKRRGGTYKSESQSTTKSIWDGSFNPLRFEK